MPRKDPHSAKSLRPEDYEVVEYLYTKLPEFAGSIEAFKALVAEFRADMERVNALLAEKGEMIHGGWSSCDHCGAHYHHGVLLKHIPTGHYITIGWQCAEERFSLDNITFQRKRIETMLKAIRKRRSALAKARINARDNKDVLAKLRPWKQDEFLGSLRRQIFQRGTLTELQMEAIDQAIEKKAKWAREREERDARMPEPAPVIEGRIEIEGEVLSAKLQEGYYGDEYKWLVVDDRGFKVWGTIPSAIFDENVTLADLRGRRVSFTAAVEKSKNDDCFGFYKRPTRASLEGAAA